MVGRPPRGEKPERWLAVLADYLQLGLKLSIAAVKANDHKNGCKPKLREGDFPFCKLSFIAVTMGVNDQGMLEETP
jgi:hypothetical protein